ncbi:MAG: 50S ribosomal protein L6 [Patescibacteria group bacterium]|nr:50S ribosomal protein L6 [Patescibacteria group bacterium]
MSRIGKLPIKIPQNVTVSLEHGKIKVVGPKGELSRPIVPEVEVLIEDGQILVSQKMESKTSSGMQGLMRTLIANMVEGVTNGFNRGLELSGVGFRAAVTSGKLVLNVGYSHPVEITAPEGINFNVSENTKITVSGINKELVGEMAAKIRNVRRPEPYKGKGIKYQGEVIRRKAGKAGKVAGGGK